MAQVTALEYTCIGAVAGTVEVGIMQPTVGIKNALQEGRRVPTNLLALYRGVAVNAGSIAPITAIQFGVNRYLERRLAGGAEDLSGGARIAVAITAGAASTAVGCPAEMVMIQQQKTGKPLASQFIRLISDHGFLRLYRGLGMTMVRDGLYTGGYLGLCPILADAIQSQPAFDFYPSGVPLIISGAVAGVSAAVITHPADTIKTRLQAFLDHAENPEYRTSLTTLQHIVRTQGVASLWAGIAPRAFRIVGAMIILQTVRTRLVSALEWVKRD